MAESIWTLTPQSPELARQLSEHLNVPPIVCQVLLNRGVRSLQAASDFLTIGGPTAAQFDEKELMTASKIILETVEKRGRILVYGDYDVDGMTSTATMVSALQTLGAKVSFLIPHRFTDGYGLSKNGVEIAIHGQYALLITLDCGISNAKEIAQIKEASGAKVIIMDHHTMPDVVPDSDAILNPKMLPEGHALSGLCTAGIVLKFLQHLQTQTPIDLNVDQYLDLAALGTIADIAPLTAENRRLTQAGLGLLTRRSRPGIGALLEAAGFDRAGADRTRVSARDVGFTIAPRLNASGRLSHAKLGVELLMATDRTFADPIAQTLNRINQERQQLGELILKEALPHAVANAATDQAIALAGEMWHAGIIGITASQIAGKVQRPVVMISASGALARGSARTFGQVNIYELLKACRRHFVNFGGHKEAAGFSIEIPEIPAFQQTFRVMANAMISADDLRQEIKVDGVLTEEDFTLEMADAILPLAPFGKDNPPPIFYSNRLKPIDFKTVGADSSHLKVTFRGPDGVVDAIGFGLGHKLGLLGKHAPELLFHLETNTWSGRTMPQLQIIDIK